MTIKRQKFEVERSKTFQAAVQELKTTPLLVGLTNTPVYALEAAQAYAQGQESKEILRDHLDRCHAYADNLAVDHPKESALLRAYGYAVGVILCEDQEALSYYQGAYMRAMKRANGNGVSCE